MVPISVRRKVSLLPKNHGRSTVPKVKASGSTVKGGRGVSLPTEGTSTSAEEGGRAVHQRSELGTIDHALTGINEASHVCGEVIKALVAASPPVNRTKGSAELFSEVQGEGSWARSLGDLPGSA